VKTRTAAQIRSHAQKYVIRLCRKYNIKLKTKNLLCEQPLSPKKKKLEETDHKILNIFNYEISEKTFAEGGINFRSFIDRKKNRIKAELPIQIPVFNSKNFAVPFNKTEISEKDDPGNKFLAYLHEFYVKLKDMAHTNEDFTNILLENYNLKTSKNCSELFNIQRETIYSQEGSLLLNTAISESNIEGFLKKMDMILSTYDDISIMKNLPAVLNYNIFLKFYNSPEYLEAKAYIDEEMKNFPKK
jgi:hypothetical protein